MEPGLPNILCIFLEGVVSSPFGLVAFSFSFLNTFSFPFSIQHFHIIDHNSSHPFFNIMLLCPNKKNPWLFEQSEPTDPVIFCCVSGFCEGRRINLVFALFRGLIWLKDFLQAVGCSHKPFIGSARSSLRYGWLLFSDQQPFGFVGPIISAHWAHGVRSLVCDVL